MGPSSWSTDTFHELGQQNACPDVNVRLKSSICFIVITVTCNIICCSIYKLKHLSGLTKMLQFDNCCLHQDTYFGDLAHETY